MTNQTPSVGRIVHYVSHGTPTRPDGSQAYTSVCRAAIVTAVPAEQKEDGGCLSLCILNPTGTFFHEHICYSDGGETPGDPNCPNPHRDLPFRYCQCGWQEASLKPGTWHWPERVGS